MDQKVGKKLLQCTGRVGACNTDKQNTKQAKNKNKNKKQNKQTNKQKSFKHLGSWTFFAFMLKIQLLIKLLPYAMQSRICPPPPFTHAHTFQSVGGQVPYFDPGFNAVYLKKMNRYAQCTSEPSNGSWLALVVEAGLKADDYWNMKICNNKQYMYFTCTFAL